MRRKLLLLVCIVTSFAFGNDGKSYLKDGKMYLYADDENNVIECQVQQLCNIALVQGDIFKKWIMRDGAAWNDSARENINYVDTDTSIQHLVLQATDISKNNPVILVGAIKQYHFNLIASKTSKINDYVFIEREKAPNNVNSVIDNGLVLDLNHKHVDTQYYMKGDLDSPITPINVFNDGKKTYIQLRDNIDTTDLPVLHSFDSNGILIQLNNARYRKPYFIIDNLVSRIAITSGSVDNDNQIRVDIYKGEEPSFFKWLLLQYDRG